MRDAHRRETTTGLNKRSQWGITASYRDFNGKSRHLTEILTGDHAISLAPHAKSHSKPDPAADILHPPYGSRSSSLCRGSACWDAAIGTPGCAAGGRQSERQDKAASQYRAGIASPGTAVQMPRQPYPAIPQFKPASELRCSPAVVQPSVSQMIRLPRFLSIQAPHRSAAPQSLINKHRERELSGKLSAADAH